MLEIEDKFNIIQNIEVNDIDYISLINNFIENYLESEVNIVHPVLIHQLVWNNVIRDIENIINIKLKNYILNLKNTIKNLIKKDKFDVEMGLNKVIMNFSEKNKYFNTLFRINNKEGYILFHNIIISDPIIINFIETELSSLDKSKYDSIKKLLENIKDINSHNINNYLWFLKLIGKILADNLPTLKIYSINKDCIEFNMLLKYIDNIQYYYHFLENDITEIYNIFSDIIYEKLVLLFSCDKLIFINEIFSTKIVTINNIIKNNNTIVKLKDDISTYLSKYFTNKEVFTNKELYDFLKLIFIIKKNGLIDFYILSIFNNDKIINNFLELIDIYINSDFDFINNIIPYFKNIKEKDIFINNYHKNLIKRLLSFNTNLDYELQIVISMIDFFEYKEINKLSKTIIDVKKSIDDCRNFGSPFNLITTSYSNWNLDYNIGYIENTDINKPNSLSEYINLYNTFYSQRYENKRKLLWLIQYGEIVIEYNDKNIKLFPIHLLILELFNYENNIDINNIKKEIFLKNYAENYINNIIKSLIIGGLLDNNSNILSLNDTVSDTDLIHIYFSNLSDEKELSVNCTNDIDVIETRKYCISSWINHYVKCEEKSFDELFMLLKEKIKLFSLELPTLKNTLDWMVTNDYVKYENDKYIKLFY